MHTRTLGHGGPVVSAIGLGCMGLSHAYGPSDEKESLATIDAALDAGIDFLDTADFYGSGHNELLLARALAGRRQKAILSVKFGVLRDPAGGWGGMDGRPAAVGNSLAQSLRKLHTDYIDLFVPARLDPGVPVEDTVGALARWVEKGFVRHVGLSEVSAATIRRAHAVHPIRALQIEYSLASRGIEAEVLPTCRELGIAIVAYGVLGRGLLGGSVPSGPRDGRARFPRFQGENLAKNLSLVEKLRDVAAARGLTPAQLALAWALARGEDIVPIVGARRPSQVADLVAAAAVRLDDEALRAVEAAVPPGAIAGARYPAESAAHLDGNL